jgi:subfamily B ATP-binding cassette protein MsbA
MSLLFFYRALSSLTILQTNWNQFLMVSGSMNNIQEFLLDMAGKKESNGFTELTRLNESIKLNDLTFFYGDTLILDKINLHIPRNKSIAFVGESGSGKSTLVNVLAGLLKAKQGQMLVDEFPIEDLVKETYQKRIGYITQEPVIFNDTIFNNVTLWAEKSELNLAKYRKALEYSSILEYVNTLPEGESTFLGHSGISLSGGQRQRLSIARELFKDVDVLIMDEATSALDSETEFAIKESLNLLHGKLTIISVAHRLSTIKNADTVVFMEKGKILGSGKFDELYQKLPKFKRMVDFQEL